MNTKAIFLSSALLCSAAFSFGQVRVESNGNLTASKNLTVGGSATILGGLGVSGNLTASSLSTNSLSARSISLGSIFKLTPYDNMGSNCISVQESNAYGDSYNRGVYINLHDKKYAEITGVHSEVSGRFYNYNRPPLRHIGVFGKASTRGPATYPDVNSMAVGVAGVVTDPAPIRIAVAGFANGDNNLTASLITGVYAGYFEGQVKVTNGTLSATLTSSSDERFKKNMLSLGKDRVLDKLMLLKPIAYNFKQVEIELDSTNSEGEKMRYTLKRYDEKSQLFQKKHYGLSAQELQKVYSDLVYEDGDGYLSINYTGLIPLLLQAIQEQQVLIEQLQKRLPDYGIISSKTASVESEQVTK